MLVRVCTNERRIFVLHTELLYMYVPLYKHANCIAAAKQSRTPGKARLLVH